MFRLLTRFAFLACAGGGDAEKEYFKRMEARRHSRQTQRNEAKDERARAYQEKEREKVTHELWKASKEQIEFGICLRFFDLSPPLPP